MGFPFDEFEFVNHNFLSMCKLLLTSLLILALKMDSWSQAFATKVEYQKTQQSAAGIQLPYASGTVEDALKDYMAKKGYKSTSSKGFVVFRGARLDSNDADLSDLYFTVERKSRKEKDETLITLLPAKSGQDILTDSSANEAKIEKAKSFLDNMAPFIGSQLVQLQINDQDASLKKAQKKMNGLMDDRNDLDKKIRKLKGDLDQNQKDQVKEASDLQSNINADDDTKKKNQRKIKKLLDNESDMERKLKSAESDLEQNKKDQNSQQQEIDKLKQGLETIKARQTNQ